MWKTTNLVWKTTNLVSKVVLERDTMTLVHPLHQWLLYDYWFLSKWKQGPCCSWSPMQSQSQPQPRSWPKEGAQQILGGWMNKQLVGASRILQRAALELWQFFQHRFVCVCVHPICSSFHTNIRPALQSQNWIPLELLVPKSCVPTCVSTVILLFPDALCHPQPFGNSSQCPRSVKGFF